MSSTILLTKEGNILLFMTIYTCYVLYRCIKLHRNVVHSHTNLDIKTVRRLFIIFYTNNIIVIICLKKRFQPPGSHVTLVVSLLSHHALPSPIAQTLALVHDGIDCLLRGSCQVENKSARRTDIFFLALFVTQLLEK